MAPTPITRIFIAGLSYGILLGALGFGLVRMRKFWEKRRLKMVAVRDPKIMLFVAALNWSALVCFCFEVASTLGALCASSYLIEALCFFSISLSYQLENVAVCIRLCSHKSHFDQVWRVKFPFSKFRETKVKNWIMAAAFFILLGLNLGLTLSVYLPMMGGNTSPDSKHCRSIRLKLADYVPLISIQAALLITQAFLSYRMPSDKDFLKVSEELSLCFKTQALFFCTGFVVFIMDALFNETRAFPGTLMFCLKTLVFFHLHLYAPLQKNSVLGSFATVKASTLLRAKSKLTRTIHVKRKSLTIAAMSVCALMESNPVIFSKFYDFVKSHYCEELVLFLKEASEWHQKLSILSLNDQHKSFQKLIQKFVVQSAPYQINISAQMRSTLVDVHEDHFRELSCDNRKELFGPAIAEVEKMLVDNFWNKFQAKNGCVL